MDWIGLPKRQSKLCKEESGYGEEKNMGFYGYPCSYKKGIRQETNLEVGVRMKKHICLFPTVSSPSFATFTGTISFIPVDLNK